MHVFVTISLFFEITGSEIFDHDIGYTETRVDLFVEDLKGIDLQKYVEGQRNGYAEMCNVPVDNVRIISREEYEENTGE